MALNTLTIHDQKTVQVFRLQPSSIEQNFLAKKLFEIIISNRITGFAMFSSRWFGFK